MTSSDETTGELERAVRRFVRRWRRSQRRSRPRAELPPDEIASMPATAFRVLVAERLHTVERDMAEVRTRINGLLFVVVGAVVTQLVLRLVA